MEQIHEDRYEQGYLAGYRDGIRNVLNNRRTDTEENSIANLPIEVMTISTRARNCLARAGCISVADAAALDERTIIRTNQMGPKTTSEIAKWMICHGYAYTAWALFM